MTDRIDARLDHLFDVELRYQEGMPPIVAQDGQDAPVGDFVGSGVGRVAGPAVSGSLR